VEPASTQKSSAVLLVSRSTSLYNSQRHLKTKGFIFMAALQTALQVLLAITSLLLTLLILLHKGRGGGLSDMFGGGVTSSVGSSGVAERNLNRITIILGLVWVVVIIALGLFTRFDLVA
jgi:preprotein translocase subunit SecG